jgi:hypothetical protein
MILMALSLIQGVNEHDIYSTDMALGGSFRE